jgi:hypothetical protein
MNSSRFISTRATAAHAATGVGLAAGRFVRSGSRILANSATLFIAVGLVRIARLAIILERSSCPAAFAKEGDLTGNTQQLMLEGLTRAATDPQGQPLHGSRARPGIFPSSSSAKQVAQQCKDAGYLHVLRTETRGKNTIEICAISEKGVAYLLSQVSPKPVLESFLRAVEARGQQVEHLIDAARQCQAVFDSLKNQLAIVLAQVKSTPAAIGPSTSANGSPSWKHHVLNYLAEWQRTRPNEDCPLPDLLAKAREVQPSLTIGQFHDGLRLMHDQDQVFIHPWTGPLYEIPDPACALLIGHAVAYYVSKK